MSSQREENTISLIISQESLKLRKEKYPSSSWICGNPYREAVKLSFPQAKIAVDSFHVIRTLNDVMRAIRIKVMNKYRLGKSGPEHDDSYYYMLKKFHYFFLKNYEDIYDGKIHIPKFKAYWHKSEIMGYLLSIDDDLKDVYRLKEDYREFNLTADYETCDDALNHLIHRFRNHKLVELRTFGKTLDHWKEEIKNSMIVHQNRRISNGPIEAANSKNQDHHQNFNWNQIICKTKK